MLEYQIVLLFLLEFCILPVDWDYHLDVGKEWQFNLLTRWQIESQITGGSKFVSNFRSELNEFVRVKKHECKVEFVYLVEEVEWATIKSRVWLSLQRKRDVLDSRWAKYFVGTRCITGFRNEPCAFRWHKSDLFGLLKCLLLVCELYRNVVFCFVTQILHRHDVWELLGLCVKKCLQHIIFCLPLRL